MLQVIGGASLLRLTGAAIRLKQPTAVVTFNMISLSYSPGLANPPIAAIQLVLERSDDYRFGAAVAAGTTLGIGFGTRFGVPLEIWIGVTEG